MLLRIHMLENLAAPLPDGVQVEKPVECYDGADPKVSDMWVDSEEYA